MSEKFLIVSLGSIGRRHLRNLRQLKPQARIGVLRLSGGANEGLPEAADFLFTDLGAARAFKPTAAIICSPATTHLRVAMALVGDGVPLLIEKPIAHELSGLDSLINLATERDVPLMTGYNLRFMPSLIEVRRLLQAGVIGDVMGVRAEVGQYLPDWRPDAPYQASVSAQHRLGGGTLLELSHEIDYIYWMFGAPARVVATGGRYGGLEIDVEDMVSLCLSYDRPRRLVNIHLDFLQRAASRNCKFIGSEGTLIWNGMTECLEIYNAATRQWSRSELPSLPDKNVMYLDELTHFLDAVKGRRAPDIDGRQGRDVLRIVEAARQSMASGRVVEIE